MAQLNRRSPRRRLVAPMSSNSNYTPGPSGMEMAVATLQERVQALSRDIQNFQNGTNDLDRKIERSYSELTTKFETTMAGISARFDTSIMSLNSKIDERSRIPWAAWAVAVSAIIALGGLAYWPITAKQDDFTKSLSDLRQTIERTDDRLVPRGEHEEKWRSFDAQQMDLKASISAANVNLQRQIDEITRRASDIYTQRDAMQDDKLRIDRLSQTLNEIIMQQRLGVPTLPH